MRSRGDECDPSGWQSIRLKHLAKMKSGDGIVAADIEEDSAYPVYGGNGVRGFTSEYTHTGAHLLVGRQGALCGNVHRVDGAFWASEHAVVTTPRADVNVGWLYYMLRHMNLNQYSVAAAQPGLAVDRGRELPVLVPDIPTQKAIADFLDRKTAAIDALIEKKQKLLDLLAEKRAALINQAVTKGLDPNVPMKDSGIPWIGQIPAHWEVKRLKRISPRQTVGVVVNPSSYLDDSGEVPFIYGSEVSEGRIDADHARRISHYSNAKLRKSQLRAGDLVCVRVGDPGVTAVVPPELDGMNCGSIMIVRQAETFDSHWLCYVMNSNVGRQNVWLVAYGAAQKQYNIGHAVYFVYPVPPTMEQAEIATWLRSNTNEFARTITNLESSVARLQEYRQSLITAAVTGQIDVSSEVAP